MFHGIRSLDQFTHERRLVRTLPIASLKGATLGVDASYFTFRALNAVHQREPLLHAIGGFPSGLEASLDGFVSGLQVQGIDVVFVFKGLPLPSLEKPFSKPDPVTSRRENAWALYSKGEADQSVVAFNEIRLYDNNGSRQLLQLLLNKGIRFIVAPFTASAQIASLSAERPPFVVSKRVSNDGTELFSVEVTSQEPEPPLFDAIYGSTDILVYDVDRVISAIDVTPDGSNSGTFQYISKRSILSELNLTSDLFTEVAVSVGCELNRTTFPLLNGLLASGPNTTLIKVAADLVQAHGSMLAAISAFPVPQTDSDQVPFMTKFQRALLCIDYQPVLYPNGLIWPIKFDQVPNELHEIIGQRLPDELFFYFSRGLLGPELLKALSQGVYVVNAPADGGDALEYQKFVSGPALKLLGSSLSYLTQVLHRYYQYKSIKAIFWYQPQNELTFDKITPPLYVSIGRQWRVTDAELEKVTSKPIVNLSDLIDILQSKEEFVQHSATPLAKGTIVTFSSDREILFNTYARALQTLEFINNDHTLTPWGKMLAAGLAHNNNSGTKFVEQLITILGLLKAKLVHGEPFKPPYPGGPIRGSIEDKANALLIARIATLLPLHYKEAFAGPLSRSLLSYHSLVARQIQSQRILFESVLVSLFANGDADRLSREDDEQWWALAKAIPFTAIPGSSNGTAVKTYLDEYVIKGDKAAAKKSLESMFGKSQHVLQDVVQAFEFWDCIMAAVEVGKDLTVVDDAVATNLAKANQWLAERKF